MGDQNLATFDQQAFKDLEFRQARYFLPWNVMDDEDQRLKARDWVLKARSQGMRPLIHLSTDNFNPKKAERPSVKRYGREARRIVTYFRALGVRDFGAWNEVNHKTQPTYNSPSHAALYFVEMYKAVHFNKKKSVKCSTRSCRVVALDVLDQPGAERYIARFYKRLSPTYERRARFVGIHNYSDVNRFSNRGTGSLIKAVRKEAKNTRFWLTETGGLVAFGKENGAFACNPDSPASVRSNEARQKKALEWLFKQAKTYRRYVDRIYLYNWQGIDCKTSKASDGTRYNMFDAGLVRLDGSKRPAYDVVKKNLENNFQR
jgi:hypothetical protein